MPGSGLPKGDLEEYIVRVARRLQDKYTGRNDSIDEKWKRRRNEREPFVPEGFRETTQETKLPLIRDLIRRAQAIIGDRPPLPNVVPLRTGPESQMNADKRELWLAAAYQRMLQREDFHSMLTDAFSNDGECVCKVTPNLKGWGEDLKQKDGEADAEYNDRADTLRKRRFPFMGEHVATKTYFPCPPDEDGLCEVLEIAEHEAYTIADLYDLVPKKGKLVKPDGTEIGPVADKDYPSTCKVTTWINRTHYAILVDDKIVEKDTHDWGRPPYFHAYFSTTSSKDPAFLTESIADPVLELQDKLENMMTATENYIWLASFPSGYLEPASADAIPEFDNTGKKEIVMKPGKLGLNIPWGMVPKWMAPPPIGQDLRMYQDTLQKILDRVTLAPVLYGEIQGDISGPVQTSVVAIAKSIFGPGLANFARMYDEMAEFMQYCIENVIKEPVPVWQEYMKENPGGAIVKRAASDWEELGPDDIKGYYSVAHKLSPIIPLEQQQKQIMLAAGVDRGVISEVRLVEEGFGISDPERELEKAAIDGYAKLETYKQMVFTEFEKRIMQSQNVLGDGTPPVPPVGPGGPVPQMAGAQQGQEPGMPMNPMLPGPEPAAAPINIGPLVARTARTGAPVG